jgi:hypothetical protein
VGQAHLFHVSRRKYGSAKGNESYDEARKEIWIGAEKGDFPDGIRPSFIGIG